MELVNKHVIHKVFGKGEIISHSDSDFEVRFGNGEIKKFSFPLSLEKFFTFENEIDQKDFQNYLESKRKVAQERFDDIQSKAEQFKINYESRYKKKRTRNKKRKEKIQFSSIRDFCERSISSLDLEIKEIVREGETKYQAFDGKLIGIQSEKYLYEFQITDDLSFPPNTLLKIYVNAENYDAELISLSESAISFSIGKSLKDNLETIELSGDTKFLLKELKVKTAELLQNHNDIVEDLVLNGPAQIKVNSKMMIGQEQALKQSLTKPISFIWGPPGTGKTTTLAKIALEHIKQGNKVLMVSYSNVSVDGALLKLNSISETFEPGDIIRYGYPKSREILESSKLSSFNLVLNMYPDLAKERAKLLRKLQSKKTNNYVELSRRLKEIRKILADKEKEIVKNANFVSTTISKVIVDKIFKTTNFDVVIFDEASMAYTPQIIFAANLAKKHFICLGDFKQLPAIVRSKDPKSILKQDIFDLTGISTAVERNLSHEWMCLLDTQYRMHPEIAKSVSRFLYHNLLKSGANNLANVQNALLCPPFPNISIGLVDISGYYSMCLRNTKDSRFNLLSAFISFLFAAEASSKSSVGIITPYKEQARLIGLLIKQFGLNDKIVCSTVHQFQGSERDVIIFDVVDCYMQEYIGTLLTKIEDNLANRLFNVAITRSKAKFIIVGNVDYLKIKNLSKSLLLYNMTINLQDTEHSISGKNLLSRLFEYQLPNFNVFDKKQADKAFLLDLRNAKKEIRFDIASEINDSELSKKLLSSFQTILNKKIDVFMRAESNTFVRHELRKYVDEFGFVKNPITIIDEEIIWFGYPTANHTFIHEGEKSDSLIVPIFRIKSSTFAKTIIRLHNMNKARNYQTLRLEDKNLIKNKNLKFKLYCRKNFRCPKCKSPLKLKKNKINHFYLSCSRYPDCASTKMITRDMLNKFLFEMNKECKYCKEPLVATVEENKGIIAICKNDHVLTLDEL